MGEAKRRKQQLGDLYGTPEGSNRPLIVYRDSDQERPDQKSLQIIRNALAAGKSVTLIGTTAARPLALAAGLPWLHEIPMGEAIPQGIAWDPQVAEAGGPLLPPGHSENGITVLGAGFSAWMESMIHPSLLTPPHQEVE